MESSLVRLGRFLSRRRAAAANDGDGGGGGGHEQLKGHEGAEEGADHLPYRQPFVVVERGQTVQMTRGAREGRGEEGAGEEGE